MRGGAGQAGAFAGAISSVLALATLLRMGSVSAGWPKAPGFSDALIWWPLVGWLLASLVIVAPGVAAPAGWRCWRREREESRSIDVRAVGLLAKRGIVQRVAAWDDTL